jgi:hypothetical protein
MARPRRALAIALAVAAAAAAALPRPAAAFWHQCNSQATYGGGYGYQALANLTDFRLNLLKWAAGGGARGRRGAGPPRGARAQSGSPRCGGRAARRPFRAPPAPLPARPALSQGHLAFFYRR